MTKKEAKEIGELSAALELYKTPGGMFLLSKAIAIAIHVLSQVEGVERENGDIRKLELLHKHLFNRYPDDLAAQEYYWVRWIECGSKL